MMKYSVLVLGLFAFASLTNTAHAQKTLDWATGYPKEGTVAGSVMVRGTCSNAKITVVYVWCFKNSSKKGTKVGVEMGVDASGEWGVSINGGTNVGPPAGTANNGDLLEIIVQGTDNANNTYILHGQAKSKTK